jgi:Zn-dependent protease with chaperone function
MHLILLGLATSLAFGVRWAWKRSSGDWNTRWQLTLGTFLFSPLLLLVSAIAIIWMGPFGRMVRWWEGWGSYGLATGFLSVAVILAVQLAIEAQRSLLQVRQLPQQEVQATSVRLLENPTPFMAQVGFWNPELVMSDGLLETLDEEHLAVALMHESAHHYYRDTFWFFWLGWLRRLTSWLPNTESLWQELMILREMRADRWAAQHVDRLLLAEALLSVVSASQVAAEPWLAALSDAGVRNRFTERIDALLDETDSQANQNAWAWVGLALVLLPLFMVPFHA